MIKATQGNLLIQVGDTSQTHGLISSMHQKRALVLDCPMNQFAGKYVYYSPKETDIEVSPNVWLIDRFSVKGWEEEE